MKKQDLVNYLDDFLNIKLFTDKSKNGLQVDNNKSEVKKIGYSVDASTYIFEKAKNENIDLVLCHHGMYWGFESTLVGIPFKRAKLLIDNDIALYACHLPLDAHREVGNNMGLLKGFVNIFGLRDGEYRVEPFGEYNGNTIGFGLRFDNKIHISSLQTLFAETLQLQKKLYNFANHDFINSIAFLSGGGGEEIKEANTKGYDLFITGEAAHHQIMGAKELLQSIMLCGHYETEKIGPKLLAYHLKDKFDIEVIFLDEKY